MFNLKLKKSKSMCSPIRSPIISNDAFTESILRLLCDDAWVRRKGYGKYPGDSKDYEQYVLCIDDEASLLMEEREGEALLQSACRGPWMTHLKCFLTRPTLALFDIHMGSTMAPQTLHQDWGDTPLFNVIVPLNDDTYGIHRAGTTCIHWDGTSTCKGENCVPDLAFNQFAIFAHVHHHRTASTSRELCSRRRVAIMQFCEPESLNMAWEAVELHRKQHTRERRKRTLIEGHMM